MSAVKLSLRGRLAVWYAIAIPLIIFALAYTAQQVMLANLHSALEDGLKERTKKVTSNLVSLTNRSKEQLDALLERLVEEQFASVPLFVRIAEPDGVVVSVFGDIPDPVLPSLDRQLPLADSPEGHFGSIRIKGAEALRVFTVRVIDPSSNAPMAIVQTGDSLSPVMRAEKRLWMYTSLEGFIGSLLALGVGFLIIRRGLRPLDTILARVRATESESLMAELPDEPRPPELQQLVDSLNEMWSRLDAAFSTNRTFVASASHDIRTPLTILQGQTDLLLMEPSLDPEVREALQKMRSEVRRLVRLTNNLLLNALMESRPSIVAQPVLLRGLLEEVVSETWVLAEGLDLGLEAPEEIVIPGDRDLLKQMVLNITDNAIKFTPRGGRVDLSLAQEHERVIIAIKDTGPGMTNEQMSEIGQPFRRGRSSGKATGVGTGLGLAIVKQIAELHGGHVEIASEPGRGTEVRMVLPCAASDDTNQVA